MSKRAATDGNVSVLFPVGERTAGRAPSASKWNFAEWFVLSQTFLPALLYLPGSQPFRIPIRMSSYVIPLAVLFYFVFSIRKQRRGKFRQHPAVSWLVAAIAYLGLMLAHPTTNNLLSGLAQIGLYLSIFSPLIWAPAFVNNPARLKRLLWLLLICNGMNSLVGVMQVRDPGTWMPREFSSNVMNGAYGLDSLSFVGSNGERILRPPGLSDAPGAVAGPAVFALYLGLVSSVTYKSWWKRLLSLAFASAGVGAIFFSLVRSSLLIGAGMVFVYIVIQLRRGKVATAGTLIVVAALTVTLMFFRASEVGGQSLIDRFESLGSDDKIGLYEASRGNQMLHGFVDLLPQYPLGAGLGRWGMMNSYFGSHQSDAPPPIWVEIQWPALIVDGGIVLLVLYFVALAITLTGQAKLVLGRREFPGKQLATIVFAANCGMFALCFSYPVFLAPVGLQFWFLVGAVYGSIDNCRRGDNRALTLNVRPARQA